MNNNKKNLKTLAIFHYIYGGLGLFFLSLTVIIMVVFSVTHKRPHVNNFSSNLTPSKTIIVEFDNFKSYSDGGLQQPIPKLGHSAPPALGASVFLILPLLLVSCYFISGILNIISGVFIHRQKNRIFSLIVAGINVLSMPLGTILGIFTFILLSKNETIELYYKKLN